MSEEYRYTGEAKFEVLNPPQLFFTAIGAGKEVFRISAEGRIICEGVDVTDDKEKCYELLLKLADISSAQYKHIATKTAHYSAPDQSAAWPAQD